MAFTRRDSHKTSVFILTFFSYAFFHANRKAFSNVKTTTGEVWTPRFHNSTEKEIKPDSIWNAHHLFDNPDDAKKYQGILDTSFMLAYAIGLFVNGYIGDRVNMRLLLTFGMVGTSAMMMVFGCVCEWLTFYNKYFYAGIWILNGFLQSTGWPIVVACMGNWFGQGSRGVLLGLWSSCASVGNIIGAMLVSSVLLYGYQYAFLITSSILFSGAIFIFFGLVTSPEHVGMDKPNVHEESSKPEVEGGYGREENGSYLYRYNKAYEHDAIEMKTVKKDAEPAPKNAETQKEATVNGKPPMELLVISWTPETKVWSVDSKPPIHGPVVTPGPEPLLSDDSVMGSDSERAITPENPKVQDDVEYDIQTTRPQSLSFRKAVLLPGVVPYALAYAFLKLVNYSFFFWLPFYLSNAFHWKEDEADRLSTAYDIAGIVGGTLCGFISDRLGKRTILIVPMLLISIPSLYIYSNSPDSYFVNTSIMSVVGLFIGGSANLISAAVSADLGCQKQLEGNDKALATVTGVIDGTGSFGAAIGQIAVPYLQDSLGWHSVFYLFMICMFFTAVCLFPLFLKELSTFRACQALCRRSRSASFRTEENNCSD